jgi:hypothetical protein
MALSLTGADMIVLMSLSGLLYADKKRVLILPQVHLRDYVAGNVDGRFSQFRSQTSVQSGQGPRKYDLLGLSEQLA